MKIAFILALSLNFILNSVEIRSQSGYNLNRGSIPSIAPAGRPYLSGRSHSPDGSPDRESSRSPVRERSRSPQGRSFSPAWPPSTKILGYGLGQLGLIRLIPRTNQNRQFEFRRYIFPEDEKIQLIIARPKGGFVTARMPTHEVIVVSTSSGEVFAILEMNETLSGIYDLRYKRVKINIRSCRVSKMTRSEILETPVGVRHPISAGSFRLIFVHYNSLEHLHQ